MDGKVSKLLQGDQRKVQEILEHLLDNVEDVHTVVVGVLSKNGEARVLHSPISAPEMCWIHRMIDHAINMTFLESEVE